MNYFERPVEEDEKIQVVCPECESDDIRVIVGVNPSDYGQSYGECQTCGHEWSI